MPFLSLEQTPNPDELQAIAAEVIAYGRAEVAARGAALGNALSGDPPRIAALLRHEGELVGGATGRMELGRLFVEYLWVHEAWRGEGHGARLLRALERAAFDAGCTSALLETLNDASVPFYQRAGYAAIAVVPDYIPGFTKHIFLKTLHPIA